MPQSEKIAAFVFLETDLTAGRTQMSAGESVFGEILEGGQ